VRPYVNPDREGAGAYTESNRNRVSTQKPGFLIVRLAPPAPLERATYCLAYESIHTETKQVSASLVQSTAHSIHIASLSTLTPSLISPIMPLMLPGVRLFGGALPGLF